MRQIKFRAWDIKNKVMQSVVHINFFREEVYMKEHLSTERFYSFDEVIIEQYTGLMDKNGKEIAEGDIITSYDITREVKYGTEDIGANGHEYSFWVHGLYVDDEYLYERMIEGDCEIIGNIHENPELVKE